MTRIILALILMAATSFPIRVSAQEPIPNASSPPPTSTEAPANRKGKMDPQHPLHIGSDYYPKGSIRQREQGTCYMAFLIKEDGSVPAAQLLKSSGYPLLDTACFESVIDVPMLPGIVNGVPVSAWLDFKVSWVLDFALIDLAPPASHPPPAKSEVPRMAEDYEFPVGAKFYPAIAQTKHPATYCVLHIVVDPTGAARRVRLTRSTGSKTLDTVCINAVTPAKFIPEVQAGLAVEDTTDIAIYW